MLVNGVEVLEKVCTKCCKPFPIERFSVTKRDEDGSVKYVASWCNSCRSEAQILVRGGRVKKIPFVGESCKECCDCGKILNVTEFSPSIRGRLGVAAYCRPCHNIRVKLKEDYNERHRQHTKRYREKHHARWKAKHRLHQLKRRSKIIATDDGTLTDEVLEAIYNTAHCYWCKEEIPPEERTLEHIKELSEGGEHSIKNVTMACRSCNSARKGRTNGRSKS